MIEQFLGRKPIYYKDIDKNRFFEIFEQIKQKHSFKQVIHIVGTNGKGSTGRFLAQILNLNGFKVGHFTSPHIFDYKERFWINGNYPTSEQMQIAFDELNLILTSDLKEKLSYFEALTLLCFFVFRDVDYIILEAGVGGEFDSTNAFDKILTLFTSFGIDHIDILGKTLEDISITKLNAIQNYAIINQTNIKQVYDLACEIAKVKGAELFLPDQILTKDEIFKAKEYIKAFSYPAYQESNLILAYAGAKFLLKNVDIENLSKLDLKGRFETVVHNVVVDVGHNELGAIEVKKALNGRKINLIFNAYKDKNVQGILKILKPNINEVEIYSYKSDLRALANEDIKEVCQELKIKCKQFESLSEKKSYLVFGSFMLVENFLKNEMKTDAS